MERMKILRRRPKTDLNNLSKDRRDWLEMHGNQWGRKHLGSADTVMTPEERSALEDALNPFRATPR